MRRIEVTNEHREAAESLSLKKTLNNSITRGGGNLAGALGEVIVCGYCSGEQANTYDYDLIIESYKVDVKTKVYSSRYTPNENWNMNVSAFNTKQKCDMYCFVGVSEDYRECYIYGFVHKADFYERAVFGKKGEKDPNGNGWNFKSDCYNMLVKELGVPKIVKMS